MKTIARWLLVPPYVVLTAICWPTLVLNRVGAAWIIRVLVMVPFYPLLVARGYLMVIMGYANLDAAVFDEHGEYPRRAGHD